MSSDDPSKTTRQPSLGKKDAPDDPTVLFHRWLDDALAADGSSVLQPTAMTLATATADGVPSARVVLLKHFDQRGFVFYTNYHSRKARDLTANPKAELMFHWPTIERQVRIAGTVSRTTRAESRQYFRSRPRGSQLGAVASNQSHVMAGRDVLEKELQRVEVKYDGRQIPVPPHWGGFRIVPHQFEFW